MSENRKRLANFVKRKRGTETIRDFARKVGLSASTLNNIMNQSQNVTLDTLEHLCRVYNCEIKDLFDE